MSITIYSCTVPGIIETISTEESEAPIVSSQYCVVYKYENLYEKAIPRFGQNTPYALPGINKNMRIYNGIDREPWVHTPDDFDEYSEKDVVQFRDSLPQKDDLELLYIKMADCGDFVPENMSFLGYDAAYPFGRGSGDGFSAICDCMFLCRWHGCDKEGVEFSQEFERLNDNGLFDKKEDAIKYLYHYLNQGWADTGEYCIYEIYG